MLRAGVLALVLCGTALASSQDLAEPQTGVRFRATAEGQTLLGLGLRVKKVAFVKVKVYVVGLYVADAALGGSLSAHRARADSPDLYRELVWGDFDKRLVLRFVRDLSREQIAGAMREALAGRADARLLEQFVSSFTELKQGQECVLRWLPGGSLEVTMAGRQQPAIADKAFAAAVFGLYLGERPLQDDIKRGLVSGLPALLGQP